MLPILLVHGIARFDILIEKERERLGLPDGAFDELNYFKGIKTHLEANGIGPVYHTNQNFSGPVRLRAAQLKDKVDEVLMKTEDQKVHLIAHSMGGLDSRLMIVDLGMADRVESLTTIATPHLGISLASRLIDNGGEFWIKVLENAIDLRGFEDLTREACAEFNARAEEAEARNNVTYQVFSSQEQIERIFLPLVPSYLFLNKVDGDNDGLVPVRSQQWKHELVASNGTRKAIGQMAFPFPADHLNEVGWWDWQEAVNPLFGGAFSRQRDQFESKVKDLYLRIARTL